METVLCIGAAFLVGVIAAWLRSIRAVRALHATVRTLTDNADKLSDMNARLLNEKTRLHNRLLPLEAERSLVRDTLLGTAAQRQHEGFIVRFTSLESCGVLMGPQEVPVHFDLSGASQYTWDVLRTAEARDSDGTLEYRVPIGVLFRLHVAARRSALLVASDIEVCEPYEHIQPPKELPRRTERQKPRYSVDWRSGGIVERQ